VCVCFWGIFFKVRQTYSNEIEAVHLAACSGEVGGFVAHYKGGLGRHDGPFRACITGIPLPFQLPTTHYLTFEFLHFVVFRTPPPTLPVTHLMHLDVLEVFSAGLAQRCGLGWGKVSGCSWVGSWYYATSRGGDH
jgi:hypothetical protein